MESEITPGPSLLLFGRISLVAGTAYGVYWLFQGGTHLWDALPLLLSGVVGRFACAAVVPVVALALYWAREKFRSWYAAAELGAAIATGLDAAMNIAANPNHQSHGMLALLASIYIGVRAFDNFYKAKDERNNRLNLPGFFVPLTPSESSEISAPKLSRP